MKKIIVTIIMMLSVAVSAAEYKKSPNLVEGTLPNGLKYYIYKNKKPENKALFQLAVKAGSMQEESGDEGIAHILEHMAFNGTKKYKKNDMIKYLQSIGLDFGGDLNAHTSFEETVYKLLLPTDDEGKFRNGIEILREWANEIQISEEELESEKKVVLEEWRLSQGLSERMGKLQRNMIFGGTAYLDKYPIGTVKTIKSANKANLDKFYKKWYHPQNMAVIAVGDLDVEKTEKLIKEYFDYEADTKYTKPKEYSIDKIKKDFVVFTDPELTSTVFQIMSVSKKNIVKTGEDYKKNLVRVLTKNIINTRLINLLREQETPILESVYFTYDINRSNTVSTFVSVIKNGIAEEGIRFTCNLLKSMAETEISEVEFNLEKLNILNSIKNQVENRDSINHYKYSEDILNYYYVDRIFVEVEDSYEFLKENIEKISLSELNSLVKEIVNERKAYFLNASDKEKNIPGIVNFEKIVSSAMKEKVSIDFTVEEVKLPAIDLKEGSILEKNIEKNIDKNETHYKLSNGLNVYTKKTDFDKDKILIRLFKAEGSSSSNYDEYLNSIYANSTIASSGFHNLSPKDMKTYTKGKNFTLNSYINTYEQGLSITTDKENLIAALESLSYHIYEPKIDTFVFNNLITELKQDIETRENSPSNIFNDEVRKIYYSGDKRQMPLTLEDLNKINPEAMLSVFKSKFSNFKDFNLVIVGSIEDDEIEVLLKKYFASLPVLETATDLKVLELNIPKNVVIKDVVKGVDKKSTVTIMFPYQDTYGEEERVLYAAFSKILDLYLLEEIREKLGGVYSIYSYTSLHHDNYGDNRMDIGFSCDLNRLEEIKKATLGVVKNLLAGNIDEYKIESIVKNYELSYKERQVKNVFWLNYISEKILTKDAYKVFTPEEYKELITKENLVKFANKAISMENYVNVNLIPEKEEM